MKFEELSLAQQTDMSYAQNLLKAGLERQRIIGEAIMSDPTLSPDRKSMLLEELEGDFMDPDVMDTDYPSFDPEQWARGADLLRRMTE